MEAKFEHDLSSVGLNCPDCDSQRLSNFLVRSSLSQKSDDFDLARGWAALRQLTSLRFARRLEKPFQHDLGYHGGEETLTVRDAFHGLHKAAPKTYPRAPASSTRRAI